MADDVRYRLLDEPLLSVGDAVGRHVERLSLPALYAALVRDAVGDFPALRPHQRHVWHAFLVQVAALALHRAGLVELPDDESAWRELLLSLTPDDPDGAAWALVAPPERPALLQAPVPGGDISKFDRVLSPDALDVLLTSKQHDVKSGTLIAARPEHWMYALLSLQTQQGYSGGGGRLQGISRMNGGGGSRPGFGISLYGSIGHSVVRDIRMMLDHRKVVLDDFTDLYPARDGIGLVWLEPWDGTTSIPPSKLDPFYIEICRRVRVELASDGQLLARTKPSATSVARIEKTKLLGGRTGDAWTPLVSEQGKRVAYSAPKAPLRYDRITPLLFPTTHPDAPTRSAALLVRQDDADVCLAMIIRVLVRDRMKTGTYGYHERRIPVSRTMRRLIGPATVIDAPALVASERVKDAGQLASKVLYPAALAVFTGAPSAGERERADDTAKKRAGATVDRLNVVIDARFFADLDVELRYLDDTAAKERARAEWLLRLRDAARAILEEVTAAAPTAAMRHYRTRVRARRRFDRAFHRHFGERVAVLTGAPTAPADAPQMPDDHHGAHPMPDDR